MTAALAALLRPDGAPPVIVLSVVVPIVNTLDDVVRTLTALEREAADMPLEILVVNRLGPAIRTEIVRRFPRARVFEVAPTTTIPAMRMRAFDQALGEYVAVIEDHITVPRGWATALINAERAAQTAAQGGAAVVGGPVDNAATKRTVDWAPFLCEYSHCFPPLRAGPSGWLPGNNVVYPTALLDRYRDRLSENQWENHLHTMMRADGVALILRPDLVVGHEKHYTVTEYVTQRYLYARSFAGARVASAPLAKRIAFGAALTLLPPVLLWRIVSRVFEKHRHRVELVRSLPFLTLFACAWAAGEVVGSWFGAGDSLQKVR